MKTQRTIYHLIVDKSGSMMDCIDNTINGFNEQTTRIRGLETEFPEQEIEIGLTTFNDHVHHHFFKAEAGKEVKMTRKNYQPNGTTALLDAIGKTVLQLEESKHGISDIPVTYVIVILTDGYENSSQFFNLGQIRNLIQRLEATGKWTFSFIGATLDAVDKAEQMSIKRHNSFQFSKDEMTTAVWDKLSTSMNSYMIKKRRGDKLDDLYDAK